MYVSVGCLCCRLVGVNIGIHCSSCHHYHSKCSVVSLFIGIECIKMTSLKSSKLCRLFPFSWIIFFFMFTCFFTPKHCSSYTDEAVGGWLTKLVHMHPGQLTLSASGLDHQAICQWTNHEDFSFPQILLMRVIIS